MLQVTDLVSSISDIIEDQSSSVGDFKNQLDDIESLLTDLDDQQTSAEDPQVLSVSDFDHILEAIPPPSSSAQRPRSLTLPSPSPMIDTEDTHSTFTPSHGRSQSVTVSPATYLPSSTSDFPSPPTTPPSEDIESNERYDRILNLLSGLIGEGKEALESEGADILHRKPSHASMRRHSRGNSVSVIEAAAAAARPQSRVSSRSSGRSSRLSMRSDTGSHSELSGSSDEGDSNNDSSLRRASVELEAESDLSEFSDDAAMSPDHSRSSSMSDTEANCKVEAFRRSLHELDRVDVVAGNDMDETYDDERVEEEGLEEGEEDVMNRSPSRRISQPLSLLQTHPRSVSHLPDDVVPSHNLEAADEWDDDDPPLSVYMNSPSRNNGRISADFSAENPLLQSIKRVDTNLRRIERLSLELFHDEDEELSYDEDDLDNDALKGETVAADHFVEDADTIAVRDKFLSSMRSALRRNLARFLFESVLFIFAYLVCSPFLIGVVHERIAISLGLVMAAINQLNHHSRSIWARDSTELPGWYPARTFGRLVNKSFGWSDEAERPGLYNGLALHSPSTPSYAKTRLGSNSMRASPSRSSQSQYTLQRALPQSSLRNSFLPDADVQHHHHHFTCDHCQQKLEVVTDHNVLDQEHESVVRLARYEQQMPGRRSRRMSV